MQVYIYLNVCLNFKRFRAFLKPNHGLYSRIWIWIRHASYGGVVGSGQNDQESFLSPFQERGPSFNSVSPLPSIYSPFITMF